MVVFGSLEILLEAFHVVHLCYAAMAYSQEPLPGRTQRRAGSTWPGQRRYGDFELSSCFFCRGPYKTTEAVATIGKQRAFSLHAKFFAQISNEAFSLRCLIRVQSDCSRGSMED